MEHLRRTLLAGLDRAVSATSAAGAETAQDTASHVFAELPALNEDFVEAEEFNRAIIMACLLEVQQAPYLRDKEMTGLGFTLLDSPLPQPDALWQACESHEWAGRLARSLDSEQMLGIRSSTTSVRDICAVILTGQRSEAAQMMAELRKGCSLGPCAVLEAIGGCAVPSWVGNYIALPQCAEAAHSTTTSACSVSASVSNALDLYAVAYEGARPQNSTLGRVGALTAQQQSVDAHLSMRWHSSQLLLLFDFSHCRQWVDEASPDLLGHKERSQTGRCRLCPCSAAHCPFSLTQEQNRRCAFHAGTMLAWFLEIPRGDTITTSVSLGVCHAIAVLTFFAVQQRGQTSAAERSISSVELCEPRSMTPASRLPDVLQKWLTGSDFSMMALLGCKAENHWDDALLALHLDLADASRGWVEVDDLLTKLFRIVSS